MDQQFYGCGCCGRGQLLFPDILCLDCLRGALIESPEPPPNRYQILESAELDLENGVINEGQYLEICDRLKNN
jgi:hypothetical protein